MNQAGDSQLRPAEPPPPRAPVPPCDSVDPLDGKLSRVHWTVPRKLLEKLKAARDALSHSHPGASNAEILEAGLDLILAAHAKKKGLVEKPLSKPRPSKQGRYIPAHVRREVWNRDEGRCQFRLESGEICGSTHRLEVDHIQPAALGGVATVEGCRLACEPHNKLAARRIFGDALMDRFTRKAAKPDAVREPVAPYVFGAPDPHASRIDSADTRTPRPPAYRRSAAQTRHSLRQATLPSMAKLDFTRSTSRCGPGSSPAQPAAAMARGATVIHMPSRGRSVTLGSISTGRSGTSSSR
jgi:hypothetical protein